MKSRTYDIAIAAFRAGIALDHGGELGDPALTDKLEASLKEAQTRKSEQETSHAEAEKCYAKGQKDYASQAFEASIESYKAGLE
eukprot:COSAG01_NODE_62757_length_283_cov_0.668478_1_plen_83_part_10